jgi:hypothetical protein
LIKKTFKRYEYKYILDKQKLDALLEGIQPYVEVDPYCVGGKKYSLYNTYYDTEDYSVVRHSVSKPAFKEKLRLRSYYESPSDEDKVFVELKKKADGCVNKRRAVLKYKDAIKLIETGQGERTGVFVNDQVVKEIEYYIKNHPVFHKTYLAYDRMAYFLKEDKNIRITFDSNLRAGPAELGESGARPIVDENTYIMEIKISDHIPLWLARLMTDNKIFRHGFSKYGTYYNNTILPERIKEYVETV